MRLDQFVAVVDVLILIGVWLELYLMLEKKRRAQLRRKITLTLKRIGFKIAA